MCSIGHSGWCISVSCYVVRVVDDVGPSVYKCQSVECAFTSPVSMESIMLVMSAIYINYHVYYVCV